MSKQLSMFEPSPRDASGLAPAVRQKANLPPAARTTDPITSHQAANEVRRNGQAKSDADEIYRVLSVHYGMTAGEIAAKLGGNEKNWTNVRVTRRTCEMEEEGRIRRGPARECRAKWRRMISWWRVIKT